MPTSNHKYLQFHLMKFYMTKACRNFVRREKQKRKGSGRLGGWGEREGEMRTFVFLFWIKISVKKQNLSTPTAVTASQEGKVVRSASTSMLLLTAQTGMTPHPGRGLPNLKFSNQQAPYNWE